MTGIKKITKVATNSSRSRCVQFIGIPIVGNDGKLMNGQILLHDGTEAFFRNGLLDGNIYDSDGKISEKRPALIYENGGFEYWEQGKPNGFPAVYQDCGLYEEDWDNGVIKEIRIETDTEIAKMA